MQGDHVDQRSPTFLAPRTGFVEDNFSTDVGRQGGSGGNTSDGSGSNASDGGDGPGGNASERWGGWQMKLCSLAHCSPPAVRPGS